MISRYDGLDCFWELEILFQLKVWIIREFKSVLTEQIM